MENEILYRPSSKSRHSCFSHIEGVDSDGDIHRRDDLYPHGTIVRCPKCKTLWVSSSWCTMSYTWHKLRKLRWYHRSKWKMKND